MDDEADIRYMDACIHVLDCAIGGHRQGSSGGADDTDGGCVGEDDDGDYLEELLRNIGPEVLLIRSARGEENLERVQRASRKSLYGVEKGCCGRTPQTDRKYSVIAKGDLLHITCRTIILQPNFTRNKRYKDTDGILN
jgi:hypothetical protein